MEKHPFLVKALINIALFAVLIITIIWVADFDLQRIPAKGIVNISIGLMSMAGLCLLSLMHSIDSVPNDKGSKLFFVLIGLVYEGILSDNFKWLVNGIPEYIHVNYLMVVLSYIITPLVGLVFFNYQDFVFSDDSKGSKPVKHLLYILMIVDILFIINGTATEFLFMINDTGEFKAGPGVPLAYLYTLVVLLVCVVENLRRRISTRIRIAFLVFTITPIIAVIWILIYSDIAVSYVTMFLVLMFVYGVVHTQRTIELAQNKAKLAEQSKELTEKQMQLMVSQIQPHFLYNTLTVIYQLCGKDTKLARKTIQDFSDYLRTNMDSIKTNKPIPFEKELKHTQIYLSIELLRFGNILDVQYDIQCSDFLIPALTLQPIAENAVKYGIRSREEGGTVTISTKREDGKIYIIVHDDGMGFDPLAEKPNDGRSHVGIDNVKSRLSLMSNGQIMINSKIGEGTTVTIVLEDKNESVISG